MSSLKFNGRPLVLNPPAPKLAKIKESLSGLPADELFSTAEILKRLNISIDSLNRYAAQELADYRQICNGHQRYWGSQAAISDLRRQLGVTE